MVKSNRVVGAWHPKFHELVERARKDYSLQLGKDVKMMEVTRIWGEGRIAKFKIPPLKLRSDYVKKKR